MLETGEVTRRSPSSSNVNIQQKDLNHFVVTGDLNLRRITKESSGYRSSSTAYWSPRAWA